MLTRYRVAVLVSVKRNSAPKKPLSQNVRFLPHSAVFGGFFRGRKKLN